MYRCYLINISYFLDDMFGTMKEAVDFGRSKGYEFLIYHDKMIVASCTGPNLSFSICNSNYHNVA